MDDSAQLTRIPGIGKKTAQRLLIEIKDRLKDMEIPASSGAQTAAPNTPQSDAMAALCALGYKSNDAKRAIQAVKAEDANSEQLIKDALQWMLQSA